MYVCSDSGQGAPDELEHPRVPPADAAVLGLKRSRLCC